DDVENPTVVGADLAKPQFAVVGSNVRVMEADGDGVGVVKAAAGEGAAVYADAVKADGDAGPNSHRGADLELRLVDRGVRDEKAVQQVGKRGSYVLAAGDGGDKLAQTVGVVTKVQVGLRADNALGADAHAEHREAGVQGLVGVAEFEVGVEASQLTV